MDSFKPPAALSLQGNPSENWRRWIQRFDLYLTASGKIKEDEKVQCAILLHVIGEEALEIYNTFKFATGEDPNKISVLKKKFEDYVNPRKNTVFERYRFWECKQQEGETIDQFITELKTRTRSCEFGDQHDSMIRDRIVFGVRDNRLKERLLRESSELTLEKAASICRAGEASSSQVKELEDKTRAFPFIGSKTNSIQGVQNCRVLNYHSTVRNVALNISRNLVLRSESFVSPVKERITSPECVHK